MKIYITAGVLGLIGIIILGAFQVITNYQWQGQYFSYWTLSDRSSTLEAKSQYMDEYVQALSKLPFQGVHDAILFPTPTNDCESNLQAVTTLDQRLQSLKGSDENSLAYQQAISQITSQEQGQADDMTATLNECWLKVTHPIIWNWIFETFAWLTSIVLLAVGIIGTLVSID